MAKLENYTGSVELISGIRQKNNGDFPLMEAHSVQVDESGKRLDELLDNLGNSSTNSSIFVIDSYGRICINVNTGGD